MSFYLRFLIILRINERSLGEMPNNIAISTMDVGSTKHIAMCKTMPQALLCKKMQSSVAAAMMAVAGNMRDLIYLLMENGA